MVSCPKCNNFNDAGQDFCDACGDPLAMDVQEDYFGGPNGNHYMAMD
jgi:rRNA maturation endonuclease Nob1